MIRVMAPNGKLGMVPEEKIQEVLAAGGRIMTPELMREMRQAVFMEHALFNDKRRPKSTRRRRLVRSGR